MRKALLAGGLLLSLSLPLANANASDEIQLPHRHWSFQGMTGTFDRMQLQRGFQVYREVCSACHGLERVYFRNLADLGYSEAQIKAVASEYTVVDGPNDEGEMYDRPARPGDHFVGPYPNEQAARSVNNGAYPPDFSLIAKARHGGANYITAIMTGYEQAPAEVDVMPGMHYNAYFPGHQIAMAKPLSADQVTFADGTEATVEQMAMDVSAFLTWVSEPSMEARKTMGVKVLIFLSILAVILYMVKRKIWKEAH